MKIGNEVYIHGYIDEIRKDTVIIRNEGGYFGTVQEEISVKPQESSITWVTGADGTKIAFWDVPVWKVTKICEILGKPQESEDKE